MNMHLYQEATPPMTPGPWDVVLFTTCDMEGGRLDLMRRLLDSLQDAAAQGVRIRHYLLLQRAKKDMPSVAASGPGYTPCVLSMPTAVSLSRARNIMLKQAHVDGSLETSTWAAFPDDDAWYPSGFLRQLTNMFVSDDQLDLVTCRYGSQPEAISGTLLANPFQPVCNRGTFVRTVSSNTLLLRSSVVARTGYFDERLGVGAPMNGGEDLDYALRAYVRFARRSLLSDRIFVGHRDHATGLRGHYFAGSLFALARSGRRDPYIAHQLLRKLAVGTALVIMGELPIRDWWRGVYKGLGGWQARDPMVS